MEPITADDRIEHLEARVRELEDDRVIRELLARYGFNADQGRSDAYVNLFTADGALDVALDKTWVRGIEDLDVQRGAPDSGSPEDVVVRHQGHEALRRFILDPASHKAIEGMSLHLMDNNLVTRISGDSATAESYNVTLVRQGSQMVIFNASINRWTLAKVDGRWMIEECVRRRPGAPGFDRVLVTPE
jgi:hypothetical protein